MTFSTSRRKLQSLPSATRNGNIVTLSAGVLVVVLAFAAFTVDIGRITLTRAQMLNACDAAAFAGAMEFVPGTGLSPILSTSSIAEESKAAARSIASENRSGDLDSTYIDVAQDIRLGQYQWLSDEQRWAEVWGATPYTMIECHGSSRSRQRGRYYWTGG